jgi:hypothetical protein
MKESQKDDGNEGNLLVCELPRLAMRHDRGAIFGEALLETCEGRGAGMMDGLVKQPETAMRQSSGRQDLPGFCRGPLHRERKCYEYQL